MSRAGGMKVMRSQPKGQCERVEGSEPQSRRADQLHFDQQFRILSTRWAESVAERMFYCGWQFHYSSQDFPKVEAKI